MCARVRNRVYHLDEFHPESLIRRIRDPERDSQRFKATAVLNAGLLNPVSDPNQISDRSIRMDEEIYLLRSRVLGASRRVRG